MQQHVNFPFTAVEIRKQRAFSRRRRMLAMPRPTLRSSLNAARTTKSICSGKRDRVAERQRARIVIGAWAARQRHGRAKDIVRVVAPFRPDEPVRIGAKAMRRPVAVAWSQEIGIAAWQRYRVKGATGISRPFAMLLLILLTCTRNHRGQDLNEQVIAAKPEGRGVGGHAGGSTFELVGE